MTRESIFKEVKLMGQNGFGKLYGVDTTDMIKFFKENYEYNLIEDERTKKEVLKDLEDFCQERDVFKTMGEHFKIREEFVKNKIISSYFLYLLF